MTSNKLTPGANLLWESSRMMLPQHREALQRPNPEERRRDRPDHDEQFTELVGRFLYEAYRTKTPVNLRMFDPYEDVRVIGVIERLDSQDRRIRVDGEWFHAEDITELAWGTKSEGF